MNRREFISFVGSAAFAAPFSARAEQRILHIGIIDDAPIWNIFREQIRQLNYIEGQNIAFDYRVAQGIPGRLRKAAEEICRIPVDVIAVFGTPAAQAAEQATKAIPIDRRSDCGQAATLLEIPFSART